MGERLRSTHEARGGAQHASRPDAESDHGTEETQKSFGRLDVLVNNAGVFQFEPPEAVTEAEFHREFNTNVLGLMFTTQEAVTHFGPEGGSVINISSVASLNPPPMSVVYSGPRVRWM
jgi:3-oxoacyl-[acyl-carrier protein] reductase